MRCDGQPKSGGALGAPKGLDGAVEANGCQAQRPLRADPDDQPGQVLIVTGPDDLRARFAKHTDEQLAELASPPS